MAQPPHTHTLTVLFSASGPLSPPSAPTTPSLYLIVKPEPVNSWAGVSFDKWQWWAWVSPQLSPHSELLCLETDHVLRSFQTLWPQPASQVPASGFHIQINICKCIYCNVFSLSALHETFKAIKQHKCVEVWHSFKNSQWTDSGFTRDTTDIKMYSFYPLYNPISEVVLQGLFIHIGSI